MRIHTDPEPVNACTPVARVLLVDDHPAVLRQVAGCLAGHFEVVGCLPDGRDLAHTVRLTQPDLVVLDITLPGPSGIELTRVLRAASPTPKVVILTVHADPDYAQEAIRAGALAYVVKSRLASDLIPALQAALEGRRYVSPESAFPEADRTRPDRSTTVPPP